MFIWGLSFCLSYILYNVWALLLHSLDVIAAAEHQLYGIAVTACKAGLVASEDAGDVHLA